MTRPTWLLLALLACRPVEVDLLQAVSDGGTSLCTAEDPSCGNSASLYCDLSGSDCGGTGVCLARPMAGAGDCGGPVCGCDGVSYDNRCVAADLHAAVSQRFGPCIELAQPCSRSNPCTYPAKCARISITPGCQTEHGICYVVPEPDSGLILSKVHACSGPKFGQCISIAEAIESETAFDGPCRP